MMALLAEVEMGIYGGQKFTLMARITVDRKGNFVVLGQLM